MTDFQTFKEELPRKEDFYSPLTGKKICEKNMKMFLTFGKNLKLSLLS